MTVSNEISKSDKGYKQSWSANIFDTGCELDEISDQKDLDPIVSFQQDNLMNAIWRPEESSNPALLLISSGKVLQNEQFILSFSADKNIKPINCHRCFLSHAQKVAYRTKTRLKWPKFEKTKVSKKRTF